MNGRGTETDRGAAVLRVIAKAARRLPESLRAVDQLEGDLGLTSIDMVEITMELETLLALAIEDRLAAQAATVGEFVDLVERIGRPP